MMWATMTFWPSMKTSGFAQPVPSRPRRVIKCDVTVPDELDGNVRPGRLALSRSFSSLPRSLDSAASSWGRGWGLESSRISKRKRGFKEV